MLPAPRTGIVRLTFVHGGTRILEAASFGEAAAQCTTPPGTIRRFEWVPASEQPAAA